MANKGLTENCYTLLLLLPSVVVTMVVGPELPAKLNRWQS